MLNRIIDFMNSIAEESSRTHDAIPSERRKLIDILDLRDWYHKLNHEEQQLVEDSTKMVGPGGQVNLMNQKMLSSDMTQQDFLHSVGSCAVKNERYEFAERVLHQALDVEGDNPSTRHFIYLKLIKMYYKQRDDRDDGIEKCIEYCKKDIDQVDAFLKNWSIDSKTTPRIPSFKRLAIIYEKQGGYQDAINICDKALERGLDDNTKGGFEGRKKRLQAKMDE